MMGVGILAESAVDFSMISNIADTCVTLVSKVVGMYQANPLLFLGIGIGLFGTAIGIVKSAVH